MRLLVDACGRWYSRKRAAGFSIGRCRQPESLARPAMAGPAHRPPPCNSLQRRPPCLLQRRPGLRDGWRRRGRPPVLDHGFPWPHAAKRQSGRHNLSTPRGSLQLPVSDHEDGRFEGAIDNKKQALALIDRAGNLRPIVSSRSNQRCLAGVVGRSQCPVYREDSMHGLPRRCAPEAHRCPRHDLADPS
jgi:hypothetical protein